jgi:outer membrane protein TolC
MKGLYFKRLIFYLYYNPPPSPLKSQYHGMKKISLILSFFWVSACCFAQKINYNDIVSPVVPTDMGEKLVYLAWQNLPINARFQAQIKSFKQDIKLSKTKWLDDISLSSNLNEYNSGLQPADGIFIQPKANLGITFRFSTPAKIKAETKKIIANIQLTEENINQAKISLRALVLRSYENYKTAKALRDLQRQVADETDIDFSLTKQKLNTGKLSLEEYNKSLQILNVQKGRLIEAENKFNLSRIELEELIGINVKEVGLE